MCTESFKIPCHSSVICIYWHIREALPVLSVQVKWRLGDPITKMNINLHDNVLEKLCPEGSTCTHFCFINLKCCLLSLHIINWSNRQWPNSVSNVLSEFCILLQIRSLTENNQYCSCCNYWIFTQCRHFTLWTNQSNSIYHPAIAKLWNWLLVLHNNTTCAECVFCSGRRKDFSHRDIQAADQRGGLLGIDQRTVGTHHFVHTHCHRHGGRLWDAKKTEFAAGACGLETLVVETWTEIVRTMCHFSPQVRLPVRALDERNACFKVTVWGTKRNQATLNTKHLCIGH